MQAIRTVLIYGYGVMGRGVAATFAAIGLHHPRQEQRASSQGCPRTSPRRSACPRTRPIS